MLTKFIKWYKKVALNIRESKSLEVPSDETNSGQPGRKNRSKSRIAIELSPEERAVLWKAGKLDIDHYNKTGEINAFLSPEDHAALHWTGKLDVYHYIKTGRIRAPQENEISQNRTVIKLTPEERSALWKAGKLDIDHYNKTGEINAFLSPEDRTALHKAGQLDVYHYIKTGKIKGPQENEISHYYRKYQSFKIENDVIEVREDLSIVVDKSLSSIADLRKLIDTLNHTEKVLVQKLKVYQSKRSKELIEALLSECDPFRLIAPIGAALIYYDEKDLYGWMDYEDIHSRSPEDSECYKFKSYTFEVTNFIENIDIESETQGFHEYDEWYMERIEQSRNNNDLREEIRAIIGCYESVVSSYFWHMGMNHSHRKILEYRTSTEYSQGIDDISDIDDTTWEEGGRICFENQNQRKQFLNNLLAALSGLKQVNQVQPKIIDEELEADAILRAKQWEQVNVGIVYKYRYALYETYKNSVHVDAYDNCDDEGWTQHDDYIGLEISNILANLTAGRGFKRGWPYFWKNNLAKTEINGFSATAWFNEWSNYQQTVLRDPSVKWYKKVHEWISEHCITQVEEELRQQEEDRTDAGYLKDMSGQDYEIYCGRILKDAGWNVEQTPHNDQGADLIAQIEDLKVCIQCKRYSNPVGNKAVQEAIAGKAFYKGTHAVVVSNAGFTKAAKSLAESADVILTSDTKLKDLETLL